LINADLLNALVKPTNIQRISMLDRCFNILWRVWEV